MWSFVSGFLRVSVCVCARLHRPSGSSTTVENASNAAVELVVGTKPGLVAVGSATVAVLSQSSGKERPFYLP